MGLLSWLSDVVGPYGKIISNLYIQHMGDIVILGFMGSLLYAPAFGHKEENVNS